MRHRVLDGAGGRGHGLTTRACACSARGPSASCSSTGSRSSSTRERVVARGCRARRVQVRGRVALLCRDQGPPPRWPCTRCCAPTRSEPVRVARRATLNGHEPRLFRAGAPGCGATAAGRSGSRRRSTTRDPQGRSRERRGRRPRRGDPGGRGPVSRLHARPASPDRRGRARCPGRGSLGAHGRGQAIRGLLHGPIDEDQVETCSGPEAADSLTFGSLGESGTREFFTHVRFHKHDQERIVVHLLVELYARTDRRRSTCSRGPRGGRWRSPHSPRSRVRRPTPRTRLTSGPACGEWGGGGGRSSTNSNKASDPGGGRHFERPIDVERHAVLGFI